MDGAIPDSGITPDAGPPPFFDFPQKLGALDGASRNWFGWSVAATADLVVVGAPMYGERDGSGTVINPAIGAAYVFERNGDTWSQTARLRPSDDQVSSLFGYSVATNGDTIAVGAWRYKPSGQSGGVFVYERQGGTWGETAILRPLSGDGQTRFGFSVSMSGDLIAVGAPYIEDDDDPSTPAYVFEKNSDGNWGGTRLIASDESIGGLFGYSIAVSGDTVVVGAPHDHGMAHAGGAAYVFERNEDAWVQVAKLFDLRAQEQDFFGRAVAIDQDTLAVGAEFGGDPSDFDTGAVHVYQRLDGSWKSAGRLVPSDIAVNDRLGYALAIHGKRIVAGAHNHSLMGTNAGAAYVFENDGVRWSPISKLIALDSSAGDHLGSAVAIAGRTVVLGARYDDADGTDSGSIYIFERQPEL